MKLTEVTHEATEILSSDHFYLTRDSEPLPEDKLKFILGSNLGIGGGSSLSIVLLWDQKTQGTNAGNLSGGWQARDLNQEYDPDGICSLSSNQFVLDAGNYIVLARIPYYLSGSGSNKYTQARLYNLTDSSEIAISSPAFITGVTALTGSLFCFYPFTVGSSKYLEIQHYCSDAFTNGLGFPGYISNEVYTQVLLIAL